MNILIVDDEISAIEAVRKGINWGKFAGTSLYTATSLQEAIEQFNQFNIEIMLSDIEMPGGTGLDLLEWVKGNKPEVACIFMTCHADFRFAQKAIQLGSSDYLLKPLNYEEVEEAIIRAMKIKRDEKVLRKNSGAWLENKKLILKQFWKDFFVGNISPEKGSLLRYIQTKDIGIDIEKKYLPVLVSIKKMSEDFSRNEKRLLEFSIVNLSEDVFEIEGIKKEVIEFTENSVLVMLELSGSLNNIDFTQQINDCCEELIKIVRKYYNMIICCYVGTSDCIYGMPNQIENLQVIDFNNVAFQQGTFLLGTYKQRHIEYS
ncbi:MAG: response regulator, partial [Neobacillus sp.]